jgi:hypothetical protein
VYSLQAAQNPITLVPFSFGAFTGREVGLYIYYFSLTNVQFEQ